MSRTYLLCVLCELCVKTFPGVGHSPLKMQGDTILGYAAGYLDFISAWARDHAK